VVLLPGDPAYAEVQRLDPKGTASATAAIVTGVPVRLGEAVWRLTAPNAGRMTGPGTNTYLVGRGGRHVVIDPGPVIESHIEAILQATGGQVDAVLVTHTHPDHSPAAARVAALTGAPCIGLAPPPHGRQDHGFAPTREPADGEVFEWAGCRLQAVHTPGHASNHVCWWLEQDGLLFTGDHLMQGSTVVIDPPDGDMAVYLRSLRMLPQRLPGLAWLAPGHGFLIAQPEQAIERLVQHRLAREDKLRRALQAAQPASLDELLGRVYDDVPPALHPVARRSLWAHLLKLVADGEVNEVEGHWRIA
jgi:glyoxylase-like metal-dependent hydrolase (beta-lactamase superfamily II)